MAIVATPSGALMLMAPEVEDIPLAQIRFIHLQLIALCGTIVGGPIRLGRSKRNIRIDQGGISGRHDDAAIYGVIWRDKICTILTLLRAKGAVGAHVEAAKAIHAIQQGRIDIIIVTST